MRIPFIELGYHMLWSDSLGNHILENHSTVVPPNTADLGTDEKAAVFENQR